MVLVDDDQYNETLEILRGNKKLSDIFLDLKDWLKSNFNITAYNFVFRERKIKRAEPKYRLSIFLSSTKEYNSVFRGYKFDEDKQYEIVKKLFVLSQKYEPHRMNLFRDIEIDFIDFSVEMEADYYERIFNKIAERLTAKYKEHSVWKIFAYYHTVYVFFHADSDIEKNSAIGISEQIRNEFYEESKKLDEFNISKHDKFSIKYDSKENLERGYEGDLGFFYLANK